MLDSLWKGLTDRVAERWTNVVILPASLFWIGGVLAWLARPDGSLDLPRVEGIITAPRPATVALAVIVVLLSGLLVRRLVDPMLNMLAGQWPTWCNLLASILVRRWSRRHARREALWQELAISTQPRQWREERAFVTLDAWLRTMPAEPDRCMPTRLGNALTAAERWPEEKYGLDAAKSWSRLWLVMPEDSRREMTRARERLDAQITAWTWGIAFIAWTPWAWWAAPVGVSAATLAYSGAVRCAIALGDLQEAAFDLYRTVLYQSLRWLPPVDATVERRFGQLLTKYLWRGADENVSLLPE